MNRMDRYPAHRHPDGERLERLALEGPGRASRALRRHVASCERCRREVEALGALDTALSELPVLQPSGGFADRVMARVRLPDPWWVRLRAWARRRRAAVATALASAAVALGTGGFVAVRYPELRPGPLASLIVDRGSSMVWQFVIQAGRVVYESGIGTLAKALRADLTPYSALGALLTVGLMGLGALAILVRLLRPPEAAVERSRAA